MDKLIALECTIQPGSPAAGVVGVCAQLRVGPLNLVQVAAPLSWHGGQPCTRDRERGQYCEFAKTDTD